MLGDDPPVAVDGTIIIANLVGIETVTRTITNIAAAGTYLASIDAPAGIHVVVSPASLTLVTGETGTYTATFTVAPNAALGEWVFGSLPWSDGSNSIRVALAVRPVAFAF